MRNFIQSAWPTKTLRRMQDCNLQTVPMSVHSKWRQGGSRVLLKGVSLGLNDGVGARSSSKQPREEAADVLRKKQVKAWISATARMAREGVREGRLHLPNVWRVRRQAKRRSHQALWSIPRPEIRCIKWSDTVRFMPQEHPDVWLEGLLAESPRLKIVAVKRLAQDNLFTEVA